MAGVLQGFEDYETEDGEDDDSSGDEILVDCTLEQGIALALEMCPDGEAIEIHEPWCDVTSCTCMPQVIRKPVRASA